MVRCEIQIGEEERNALKDIILSEEVYEKMRKRIKMTYVVMGVLTVGLQCINFFRGDLITGGTFVLLLLALCYVILWWCYDRSLKWSMDRYMKKNMPLYSGIRQYVFDTDGIEETSGVGNIRTNWTGFKNWGIYTHYIYVRRVDNINQNVLVDINKLSEEEFCEVRDLLNDADNTKSGTGVF